MGSSLLKHATEACAKATGKRYCTHHGGEVASDQGDFQQRNHSRRWVCFACQKKSLEARARIQSTRALAR